MANIPKIPIPFKNPKWTQSLYLSHASLDPNPTLSPTTPHDQLCIFHPGNSAFNVILRIHQAASALKPGETLNPEILRVESEVVFLCSQHAPFKFPVGSHQVPNMLPRFPMCSQQHLVLIPYVLHKVFPIFCLISINWGLPILLKSKGTYFVPPLKTGGTYCDSY